MSSSKQSQAFRLSVAAGATPVPDIYIEPRYDPKTKKHIILWKDIQRVSADAKYVLDGEKVVSFMVDDDFNDIVPARILYHPGVVLKVVTAESENLPAAVSSSPPTTSVPAGQSSTSTLPSVTLKDRPSLNAPTSVKDIGKAGADVSSRDTHLDSELAALDITSVPEESSSKSSKKKKKKKVEVPSQSQRTWSEAEQVAAEKSLVIFITSTAHRQGGGLDQRGRKLFFAGDPMRFTKILAYSKDAQRQLMASGALIVATNNGIDAVDRDALSVIIHLIETDSATLQDKASTVLIRLVKDDINKSLVIELGGLKSLRHLLLSIKSLQRNYIAAISRMAMKDSVAQIISQDKETVAAIARLLQEEDVEGQKLTLGAIAHLSEIEGFMPIAIQAGLMPTVVRLTRSTHGDFGMRCLTALQRMTSDKTCLEHWEHLTKACPDIFKTLRTLLDSIDEEKMGWTMIILYNFTGTEQCRQEIVAAGTLTPLLKLIQSRSDRVVVLAISLIQHLADTAGANDRPIIESGCLERLIELLVLKKSPIPVGKGNRARISVIQTFFMLLMREGNRKAILDMHLVQRLSSIILKESPELQSGMTQCLLKLSEQVELRPMMLQMGILDTMFQLAKSTTAVDTTIFITDLLQQIAEDHEVVIKYWTAPAAGLRGYLVYLLESRDILLSQRALELILTLVDDPAMKSLIEQEDMIKAPFLRMVDLLESTTSDKTVPTETRMLSVLAIDGAGVLSCLFGW